jgi:hypothetical protein
MNGIEKVVPRFFEIKILAQLGDGSRASFFVMLDVKGRIELVHFLS